MAYQIDWAGSASTPGGVAFEIYIPKADLTLIQSNPTEIRQLDVDVFRQTLRDMEDDEDGGRPWPHTHEHQTDKTLAGITYARIVEVIPPYSVTFEDGQYSVNLVGANNNILDRTNRNQVSVNPSNSAGLISLPDVEYAAFEKGVSIDENNLTGRAIAGTIGGAGKPITPSNNLDDAKLIDDYRGFNRFYVIGNLDLDTDADFSRCEFIGRSRVYNVLTVRPLPNVTNAVFKNLTVTGELDGGNEIVDCLVNTLTYVNGQIRASDLAGTITLAGGADASLNNCSTVDPYNPPIIDMGGSGQNLSMPNYSGLLTLRNMSGPGNFAGVGLMGGQIILDDTVTAGIVHVSGIGTVIDTLGNNVPTGVWNGGVMVINTAVSTETVADEVWSTVVDGTTMGLRMQIIEKILRNGFEVTDAVSGNLKIFDDDGVTTFLTGTVRGPGDSDLVIPAGSATKRTRLV